MCTNSFPKRQTVKTQDRRLLLRAMRPPEAEGRQGPRKKGLGARQWLAVDAEGEVRVEQLSRHAVMRRTGLRARDLRILDPQLSYPSTVLGRERAIVVGLDPIKAIFTAHEVLLLNHLDPSVVPFVRELQRLLLLHRRHPQGEHHHQRREGEFDSGEVWTNLSYDERPKSKNGSPRSEHHDVGPMEDEKGKGKEIHGQQALRFEFIALEACLEVACSCLERKATTLEEEAHPALDKLTSKISTLNLEHVRQIKSRLVAITGCVQKVRDEFEHLLDDDDDMAEMYLTDKMAQQRLSDEASHSSLNHHGEEMDEDRVHADIDCPGKREDGRRDVPNHNQSLPKSRLLDWENQRTRTCSARSSNKHPDIGDLEMLLEAYFVQIDSTLNKLSTLREFVDDTEDYINIMLDDKQNHLLQMGVMLTTATLVISVFVALVDIVGMNIKIDLFDENKAGMPEFLWTACGSVAGSIILYVIAIAWCKRRRILE